MDGFPNGRRLEDDVVRIELQAVSGIALAAIGLWYDDFDETNPVSKDLLDVLTYNAGVTSNDVPFKPVFPYVAAPWPGTHNCDCNINTQKNDGSQNRMDSTTIFAIVLNAPGDEPDVKSSALGLAAPEVFLSAFTNPVINSNTIRYRVDATARINISVFDSQGKLVKVLSDKKQDKGTYSIEWDMSNLSKGLYYITVIKNGTSKQTLKLVKE
jgi:hypothetical protein